MKLADQLRAAIYAARKRAGLSQKQLADRLGVTVPVVGQIERGDRNVSASRADEIFAALDAVPVLTLTTPPTEVWGIPTQD